MNIIISEYLQMVWSTQAPFVVTGFLISTVGKGQLHSHHPKLMSTVSLLTHSPALFLPLAMRGAESKEFGWEYLHCRH